MQKLEIIHTHQHDEAARLRDAGYEPIECAFGQHGSVLGPLKMDHHGTERHREGVAIRACRDHFGARADDPRFVVTGTPDADAVLAILALLGEIPPVEPDFYELVDEHDTDPIGVDLLQSKRGLELAWFNQQERLTQNEKGFRKGLRLMEQVLREGLDEATREHVRGKDRARRRKALEGVQTLYDRSGLELPHPASPETAPLRRGEAATEGAARLVVLESVVWGFDIWYRIAPVVVSYASRMAKVTVGCPDLDTAERLFGEGGLMQVWPALGRGWGGRGAIGGSPRGERLGRSAAPEAARQILPLLIA